MEKLSTEAFTVKVAEALASTPQLWVDIDAREAAEWPSHLGEGMLQIAADEATQTSTGGERNIFTDALYALDVEAVGALIGAGVDVCRWYADPYSVRTLDPVGHVVQSYWDRANTFGGAFARKAWAQRAAECVRMLIDAGASRTVGVWIGPEFAPVLACERLHGCWLTGLESVRPLLQSVAGD